MEIKFESSQHTDDISSQGTGWIMEIPRLLGKIEVENGTLKFLLLETGQMRHCPAKVTEKKWPLT